MKVITLQIKFNEDVFMKLQNSKEQAVILGLVNNWREYILMLARIKQ